ncbi:MAG: peptidoglycan-binding protein, partial [Patescibacteria group bacterium]
MNKFKTKIFGLTIAALLSVGALVPATSSALTIDELMAQIVALQAELQKMQGTTSTADKCSFTRSLTVGSKGEDVTCLQKYLQSTGDYTYSGGATGFFGSITKAAVMKWQSANSVAPAFGYFGSVSRAKYDSLMATVVSSSSSSTSTSSTGSSSSVVAVGGALAINSATQPANSLAVISAAKLPFTKVTLTAGTQDVTVTGITVERTGLAVDSVFAGVVLLDETGAQLGIAKTLNSDHRTTVGDTVTIKAGQSKTFTIA